MEDELQKIHKLRNDYLLIEERLNLSLSAGKLAWWEMDVKTGKVVFNENKALMLGYDPHDFMNSHYRSHSSAGPRPGNESYVGANDLNPLLKILSISWKTSLPGPAPSPEKCLSIRKS